MFLPDSLKPLLRSLSELEAHEASLLATVSEIKLVSKQGGNFELLLYTGLSAIPVRTRVKLTADTLKSAALALDVLKGKSGTNEISELDLRTGTMVYATKEGGL
jgi:hypothetical protein